MRAFLERGAKITHLQFHTSDFRREGQNERRNSSPVHRVSRCFATYFGESLAAPQVCHYTEFTNNSERRGLPCVPALRKNSTTQTEFERGKAWHSAGLL